MVLMLSKCCIWGKETSKNLKLFCGFFFIVNFVLTTGYMGIPYAFFYSGYVVAIPTFIFVAIVSWINANYVLEVMARAQVSVACVSREVETQTSGMKITFLE